MTDQPTVAHVKRAFLMPTETFVGNQIATLSAYRPVVLCHHRLPASRDVRVVSYSVSDLLPRWQRLLDCTTYGLARYLPPASARALARRAQAEAACLLHFHYLVDARFLLALKRLTGLPAIVSAYGYDVSSFPHALHGYGRRYLSPIFRELDCFIAMSHDMRRDLVNIGCPEYKVVVHYHGVDTDRFAFPGRAYRDTDPVRILMCGSLQGKKAQDQVLQALRIWDQNKQAKGSFELVLMGEGPLRRRLEAMVRDLGWQQRVHFLGHVPHHDERLVQEYRKADIFTLPSVTFKGEKEGIPGTIVEAMASGLPVVSTYHAGIPEVITSGENGLLVQENDVEGLAHALGSLITDRELRARLGQGAARSVSTRCRLAARTTKLELLYDQLLASKSNRGGSSGSGAS